MSSLSTSCLDVDPTKGPNWTKWHWSFSWVVHDLGGAGLGISWLGSSLEIQACISLESDIGWWSRACFLSPVRWWISDCLSGERDASPWGLPIVWLWPRNSYWMTQITNATTIISYVTYVHNLFLFIIIISDSKKWGKEGWKWRFES